jgi:sugar phosphate isomerase/epimerase
MTKVAAQLYTLRNVMKTPAQIDAGFARLKADGWKAVQASGVGPIAPAELKAIADRHGLEICATHVSFDNLSDNLDSVLKDHAILDCPYIGLGAMPDKFRGSADGFHAFARAITPIAERIREAGRMFVYHNHNFEFARFGKFTGMDILVNECGGAVQFEPDTYWVQTGGGDVVHWLGRLAGRIDVVHFKDMVYETFEGQAIMAEVGEGNLNWPEIIKTCAGAGVRWHIVEQDVCRRDPFDSLKMSLENLHALGLS